MMAYLAKRLLCKCETRVWIPNTMYKDGLVACIPFLASSAEVDPGQFLELIFYPA